MPSAYTLDWFRRLPALHRAYDTTGQLLGFLDGPGIEGQAVDDLVARIDRRYPDEGGAPNATSDLVNPLTAKPTWLQWIAMLNGVELTRSGGATSFAGTYGQLTIDHPTYALLNAAYGTYSDQADATTPPDPGFTVAEQRTLIAERPARKAGSTGSIRALIESVLTGTRKITFDRHYTGNWARVRVITYAAETPFPWKVDALLQRPDVAPGAVELTYQLYAGASYGQLSTEYPTYALLNAGFVDYAAQKAHIPV